MFTVVVIDNGHQNCMNQLYISTITINLLINRCQNWHSNLNNLDICFTPTIYVSYETLQILEFCKGKWLTCIIIIGPVVGGVGEPSGMGSVPLL